MTHYNIPSVILYSTPIELNFAEVNSAQLKTIHYYPPYIGDFEFGQPCHNQTQSRLNYHAAALYVARVKSNFSSGYVSRLDSSYKEFCFNLLDLNSYCKKNDFNSAVIMTEKNYKTEPFFANNCSCHNSKGYVLCKSL